MQHGPLHRRLPLEGQGAGEHFVGHDAEGVDVAPLVERIACELLGAHVRRRADDGALTREFGFARVGFVAALGDAEVENFDEVALSGSVRDHNVFRFEIAMDDASRVGFRQRAANLTQDASSACKVQLSFSAQDARKVFALDELHHEKQFALFGCPKVVDVNGVRVLERGENAHLTMKPLPNQFISRKLTVQRFDGDLARMSSEGLLSNVDCTHSALAEPRDNTELASQNPA